MCTCDTTFRLFSLPAGLDGEWVLFRTLAYGGSVGQSWESVKLAGEIMYVPFSLHEMFPLLPIISILTVRCLYGCSWHDSSATVAGRRANHCLGCCTFSFEGASSLFRLKATWDRIVLLVPFHSECSQPFGSMEPRLRPIPSVLDLNVFVSLWSLSTALQTSAGWRGWCPIQFIMHLLFVDVTDPGHPSCILPLLRDPWTWYFLPQVQMQHLCPGPRGPGPPTHTHTVEKKLPFRGWGDPSALSRVGSPFPLCPPLWRGVLRGGRERRLGVGGSMTGRGQGEGEGDPGIDREWEHRGHVQAGDGDVGDGVVVVPRGRSQDAPGEPTQRSTRARTRPRPDGLRSRGVCTRSCT